jgi:BirA family transcriptional regulator, biotin operon repressor / biotin---[acetyl-CoA-carboxylase] ligase
LQRDSEREKGLRERLARLRFIRLVSLNPICLFSVNSTQDYLSKNIHGNHEGDFAVARLQTMGKGREGRGWISDDGGLYLSIFLVPNTSVFLDKLETTATLAIKETFEADFQLSGCYLKAPNDVLCRGKKIAGVLVDAEITGSYAKANLGIGIDLNNGRNWRDDFKQIATSYFLETGNMVSVDDFIVRFLFHLDGAYNNLLQMV